MELQRCRLKDRMILICTNGRMRENDMGNACSKYEIIVDFRYKYITGLECSCANGTNNENSDMV